jgi:perosamine synthetase
VTGEAGLAPGAPAAAGTIPLAVPHLGGREWEYVREALDTNWVSSVGPFVDRFEQQTASYLDAGHAVAVVSGTAALHLALLLAGVGPDDAVVVPTLTFIAPANAIRYTGAEPVFIDAEPDYWQLDVEKVAEFLERECTHDERGVVDRATGRRVRAILPVHVLGHPVDLDPLLELARRYGLVVVEDAAESIGGRYRSQALGTFGTLGCLSFNGNKVVTAGGGGMVVTADAALAERARYLTTQAKDDPVEYVHGAVGFNYRLSNVLAAIGCAQLELVEEHVAAKRRIAARYAEAFAGVEGLTWMREAPWAFGTFWLATMLVDERRAGVGSRELLRRLAARGVQSRPLWQPLHLSKPYAGARAYRCETAERIAEQALSLPSSVGLTEDDQALVIDAVLAEVRS